MLKEGVCGFFFLMYTINALPTLTLGSKGKR